MEVVFGCITSACPMIWRRSYPTANCTAIVEVVCCPACGVPQGLRPPVQLARIVKVKPGLALAESGQTADGGGGSE